MSWFWKCLNLFHLINWPFAVLSCCTHISSDRSSVHVSLTHVWCLLSWICSSARFRGRCSSIKINKNKKNNMKIEKHKSVQVTVWIPAPSSWGHQLIRVQDVVGVTCDLRPRPLSVSRRKESSSSSTLIYFLTLLIRFLNY